MSKRFAFEERAKQEVTKSCMETFERLCRSEAGRLPDELLITMRARWASGIAETQERVIISKPISYVTSGRLTGEVEGYQVSVFNDGLRHFRLELNGQPRDRPSQKFVEEELKIPVQKRQSGSRAGYSSEAMPRAVWRYLTNLYNDCDPTVHYERARE